MNNLDWNDFVSKVSDYVGADTDEITRDTDIYEDLCLDSLGVFSLGAMLTEQYKLNVSLSSVAVVCRLGEIFDILNEQGVPTDK